MAGLPHYSNIKAMQRGGDILRRIDKKDMIHLGGKIYNHPLDAREILNVSNGQEDLRFSYNIGEKILSIMDYKVEFEYIMVHYL